VQWPGIGYGTSVVQDGTQEECSDGSPNYSAWYEMVGDSAVNNGAPVTIPEIVNYGDAITAWVSIANNEWTLYMHDTTEGWTFDQPEANTVPGLNQQATEVVVEGPNPPSTYGLADFGTVSFTGVTAVEDGQAGPLSAFSPIQLDMTYDSTTRATAGPLNPGNTFTVTWDAN
jgi:hypothetical protein